MTAICGMRNIGTWMRRSDEKYFAPFFAKCLDIAGHNLPDQKTHDVQPLRSDRKTRHPFEKVNSSHHQAINKLGAGLEVESWCATDDIIEQARLRDYPFALGVQYHPERGKIYDELFDDFLSRIGNTLNR